MDGRYTHLKPPSSIEKKRKEWQPPPVYTSKAEFNKIQNELENKLKDFSKERTRVNQLLGKLEKQFKKGIDISDLIIKSTGETYYELLRKSEILTNEIDVIENELQPSKNKIFRMNIKKKENHLRLNQRILKNKKQG